MIRLVAYFSCLSFLMLLFGCSRLDERKINADTARETSISRLEQGKTYMLVDGLDDAMAYYQENNDTTKFLEVCQLLAIRTRWNGKPDSAAMYLRKALDYATITTSPSVSDLYIDLANHYSNPLAPKDYRKAIFYAQKADSADVTGSNRARTLHDIGIFYAFLNENDSARFYIEKAIELTPPTTPEYHTFVLNYAGLSSADFVKSLKYLDSIGSCHLGKLITKGFLYFNHNNLDSATSYLRQSQELYDRSPDAYSINTYNGLRLLGNCISYARNGKVYPGEGTERNDSVGKRMMLNQKIKDEITEYNSRIRIELLNSESRSQKIWILALAFLFIAFVASALIFWKSKRKIIRLHNELDSLRRAQILIEADAVDEDDKDNIDSFHIITKRAEMCVGRFRDTGLMSLVHKGGIVYNENGTFLPIKERVKIRQTILECFADFIVDLTTDAGRLTIDDIITSTLSMMRVSNSSIAACLGVSDGAVRTRKTRLKSKLSDKMAKLIFC